MRAAAWFVAIGLMAGAQSAYAQREAPLPPDVERVATAVIGYERALQTTVDDAVIERTDRVFNAPPTEIGAIIGRARTSLAAERARLAALPRPNLRGQDIDLTFMGDRVRERNMRRLALAEEAVAAAQAMLDAQASGDCAALAARSAELDRLRVERRRAGSWMDLNMMLQTLRPFAPSEQPPIPVAVDPPPAPGAGYYDDLVLVQLTQIVAKSLRCPLPGPDLRAELVVRLQIDGTMSATVASINQSEVREAFVGRIAEARFTNVRVLRNSTLVGRPIRLLYANQRLEPVR